jgi:hypothetical protein
MPEVLAICENCSTVFGSGMVFENSAAVTMVGNRAGPCPTCGDMGRVPDGVYDFLANAIRVVGAPGRSTDDLQKLISILQEAQQQDLSPDEVETKVRDELPAFLGLFSLLPSNKNEFYGFISMLATVAALLVGLAQSRGQEPSHVHIDVDQVVQVTCDTARGGTGGGRQTPAPPQRTGPHAGDPRSRGPGTERPR